MAAVRIESLSHGPHGIVRIEGKVHLVRGAAPGDLAEIEVTEDKGRFAYAHITRLLEGGPARRQAPCPFLPRCGGCSWQHLNEDAQREAKTATVREAFAKAGLANVAVDPILATPHALGYRRRLSLRVAGKDVGFFAGGTHELIPIDECLLASEPLHGAIALARRWVRTLDSTLNRIEIAWTGESNRLALIGQCDGPLADGDRSVSEHLLRDERRLATVILHGKGFHHVLGEDRIRVALPADELQLRAGAFSQVNDGGNHLIIETLLALAEVDANTRVADLYAGAGNLSIPLARLAGSVVAIERDRRGALALIANAERLGLANLEARAAHVHRSLRKIQPASFDLIVLDPPRSGAADAMDELRRIAPPRIIYVSCNPQTLARDLAALTDDYTIDAVRPIDLFPQTPHVEVVALLNRR
ncbi:MAG: 23S rRNA (uracil(1939)-C(5))-methyltransferase RlmD [Deltaproteobacteria bacterium]